MVVMNTGTAVFPGVFIVKVARNLLPATYMCDPTLEKSFEFTAPEFQNDYHYDTPRTVSLARKLFSSTSSLFQFALAWK